ncbi:MAG: ABC transporter permease [Chitinophagales bacterium]|nr:ABC transporter permease [Chitinophagales bacterium]
MNGEGEPFIKQFGSHRIKLKTNTEDKFKSVSLSKKAWKRLLKNKPAVIGIIIICLSTITAAFCHFIAPDGTPNADEQILQLETHPPGFTITILKVEKNLKIKEQNILSILFNGTKSDYTPVPITAWEYDGANVIVDEYLGPDRPTAKKSYPLADIVYAISNTDPNIQPEGNAVSFNDIDELKVESDLEDLKKRFEKKHLEKRTFLFGSDKFGRDILSRLLVGTRVSLSVGIIAVIISLVIGIVVGSLAGYFAKDPPKISLGKLSLNIPVDSSIIWLINVFWSIPTLLLAMGLTIIFKEKNFILIYVAVGLTMWVEMARIVRGQFLGIREKEFVEASRSLGFSHFRTIFRHILPNLWGPIIVIVAANFATAILIEAGLSFIGLGVQPPKPSWGTMLNEYYGFIGTSKSYLAIYPGLAIMILVLAFNLIGNGLRDALDIKTSMK